MGSPQKHLTFGSVGDGADLPDPDFIAAEIDSRIPICSPFGLPVHVVRSRELHCRRPPSRFAQFAEIASDLKRYLYSQRILLCLKLYSRKSITRSKIS